MRTIAVGITGGIGSGKTEVCKIFESLGATVLYADTIAKKLMEESFKIKMQISQVLGPGIVRDHGRLDRKGIADIIFARPDTRRRVDAIVHPAVVKVLKKEITLEKKRGRYPVVAVEAALIFEAGIEEMFEYVVVVHANQQLRIHRLEHRDHIDQKRIGRRIQAQIPDEAKVRKADFVVNNNGDLASLTRATTFLHRLFCSIGRVTGKNGSKN